MNEYPEMDIRVTEMKTEEIHKALKHGDIDAAILAKLDGQDDFKMHQLYVEKFFVYVSKNDNLFNKQNIRTTDLSGEFLWLLDEGHCFRDQLVKFCHLKSAAKSKKAYNLGSIETFMRIVESGKGVTFIPELALQQFTDVQKELVRPFAHPIPTRSIVLLTQKNYIRTTQLQLIIDRIQASIPAEMLQSGKIKTL